MKSYRAKGIRICCMLTGLLAMVLLTGVARAETPSPWKSEAELGYLMTSGNTQTQALNAGASVTYDGNRWKHELKGSVVYSSEKSPDSGENRTTAQKYRISGQSNYKFDPRNSGFGLVIYNNDRFSGYKYQLSFAAGYARQIVKTDRIDLSAEIGPGFRTSKIRSDLPSEDGITKNEAILRAAGQFKFKLSKTAAFTQSASVESGPDNTVIRSVTALKAQINDHLALKASYTLQHNTTVPADTHKTDTETALTLVYDF